MQTEREKLDAGIPEGVNQVAEVVSMPQAIENKSGVQVVPSNFTAQVTDGNTPLIQTPQNQVVTITIPSDQNSLTQNAKKGNILDALTWHATYWLRIVKKAMHFGWKIVFQPKTV